MEPARRFLGSASGRRTNPRAIRNLARNPSWQRRSSFPPPHRPALAGEWFVIVFGAVLLMLGALIAIGGVWLVALGGSVYYLLAGAATVGCGLRDPCRCGLGSLALSCCDAGDMALGLLGSRPQRLGARSARRGADDPRHNLRLLHSRASALPAPDRRLPKRCAPTLKSASCPKNVSPRHDPCGGRNAQRRRLPSSSRLAPASSFPPFA